MAWLNPAWSKRYSITVDNSGSGSAVMHYQTAITISGAAYTAVVATAKADLSDLRVTDSDGTTLLQFALEGKDTTNSKIYLLVKVPAIAAGGTRTIYVYYGNAGASTVSSYTTTVGATNAATGPTAVYTQSDQAGYNAYPQMLRLRNQGGGSGGGSGLNGDILAFIMSGSTSNPSNDGKLVLLRSTDGGVNWTKTTLLTPPAGNGVIPRSVCELASGKIILCYGYDGNANNSAGTQAHWFASSTDGGTNWSNLAAGRSNPFIWPALIGARAAYGTMQEMSTGRLLMPVYYILTDTGLFRSLIYTCPSASDPLNGTNWTIRGTVAIGSARIGPRRTSSIRAGLTGSRS
jgi:hypothetical protein